MCNWEHLFVIEASEYFIVVNDVASGRKKNANLLLNQIIHSFPLCVDSIS